MLLNLHSYYSLRYGTLSIAELITALLHNAYDTAVLTDINNSSGALDFVRQAKEKGLNPLVGMEYRSGDRLLYIGIAQNEHGFKELNEWMTAIHKQASLLCPRAPAFEHVFVVYPLENKPETAFRSYEYVGIRPSELSQIVWHSPAVMERYVILSPLSFKPSDYKLHVQLRAIDNNLLISQLQASQVATRAEVMLPKAALMEAYSAFPMIISNTHKLLSQCSFSFDFSTLKNKNSFTGNAYDDKQLLYKYAMDGWARKYGVHHQVAKQRVLHELDIIDKLHFSAYFLITDDICRYARSRDYYYVGRGSGANSIVAYCLGITQVCPIELDLYFERFLNPKRTSPPDFDVDFSWRERDDMYDYIFRRYQSGHTALMGAMSTFKGRSMIRELGKIYGLPKGDIDRMVHEPAHFLNKNEVCNMILSVCNHLKDFPNQRTSHASGVLISELPLTYYSALDFPPKGLPVVQYDMHVAEDIGFEKFDILSQRGIGHIKDAAALVWQNKGVKVAIHDLPTFFKDPKIANQLRTADTVGCFYIESPAMRQLLSKLQCDDYLTLVAASSIIRPGVASSGMMQAYIERHHHPDAIQYPHPIFEAQLKETYGVMVYQEDVMKIGHHFGGLDLADADVLRRMMSGKNRHAKHLKEIEAKYFAHCAKMQYPLQTAQEIWRQMESFAGYSFNKAHSASFAVESYQSLYFKTYFPQEFMVAVLNNYGGFFHRKVYIHEAKKAGANIILPCVNHSLLQTCIIGQDIYLGFDMVLGLELSSIEILVKERLEHGLYTSLEQFVQRVKIGLEQLIILIRVGAFVALDADKKALLWEAHLLLSFSEKCEQQTALFSTNIQKPTLPVLATSILEDVYDEIELLGFPVSASYFTLAKSSFRGDVPAAQLAQYEGRIVRMVGLLITDKHVRTKNQASMKFGTFWDAAGDFFDTVHFPAALAAYPLRGTGLYLIEGKVVVEYGFPTVEVYRCAKMPLLPDPRSE